MALRAVPDHPKFSHLKSLLGTTKGATIGYLECVWHFAGRFTPQGNIGKYTDLAIESWVEWDGAAGELVEAMIESGWLDRDGKHGLLVHDWATHADKATKQALTRAKLDFCVPTVHTPGAQNVDLSALPVPVPESGAVPESVPEPRTVAERPANVRTFPPPSGDDAFESLYSAHPKRGDRGMAENYLAQSVAAGADLEEIQRVHAEYCASEWHGPEGRFAPTLAKWLLDKGWKYPPKVRGQPSVSLNPIAQRQAERYQALLED
ncbi:MAG: hypothetical protein JWN34_3775 [Bryobacterales bacterium]|nr:hypothetical protein [Bryobacterales bacterium]